MEKKGKWKEKDYLASHEIFNFLFQYYFQFTYNQTFTQLAVKVKK